MDRAAKPARNRLGYLRPRPERTVASLLTGAVGGLAGTLVIQPLLMATQKYCPQLAPPIRRDPGEFMVTRAEEVLPDDVRKRIPATIEPALARGLAVGYGIGFGALFAAFRPAERAVIRQGLILGAATWLAGYFGWLPAMGLMPPLWRQKPGQVAVPFAEHLVYGVTTAAAVSQLRRYFDSRRSPLDRAHG
jgi:hypothetical protein